MNTENFYSKMPNAEAIKSILAYLDATDKSAIESENQRMENYYNCVDDYSWGGRCSQANADGMSQRARERKTWIEQMESGKAFVEIDKTNVLTYQGKIVSEKIVNGKFGPCWIIPGENGSGPAFVSCSKKAATYAKKGFEVKTREIEVEYYYTGGYYQGGQQKVEARILSDKITDEFSEYPNTNICFAAWIALRKAAEPVI